MKILESIIKTFVGDKKKKDMKALEPFVEEVHRYEAELEALTPDELRNKTLEFKQKIQNSVQEYEEEIRRIRKQIESADIDEKEELYRQIDKLEDKIYEVSQEVLDEIKAEAFAVMKETAKRFFHNPEITVTATPFDRELSDKTEYVRLEGDKAVWQNSWDAMGKPIQWDMIHYDVQLIGGLVLHQGKIAEMMTGEGKTLVATLPIYLNALTGKGVHVVTVNDYLAKRDAAWMGPLYQFHGLSVDCIDHHRPNSPERRKAYNCDITYGTNNEFGFDYLRDNMAHSTADLVQRKHHYAIIDEVDSVLIDDARTPLIISGAVPQGDRHEFNELKPAVESLVNQQHKYLTGVLAEAKKLIREGNKDEGAFLLLRVYRGLPKNKALIKFLMEEGIKQLLQKTENFYMQDNYREMPKVDKELLFVIDEKNNSIELTDKGIEELSRKGGDKDFFVLPDMGIRIGEIEKMDVSDDEKNRLKEEAYREFAMKSERIHTIHQLLKAYTLFEKDVEYVIIDDKIKIVDEQTGRIMEGRRYSEGLHQAIEAKENVKIEDATQTYATITLQNYFRMYRKLAGMTGTAVTEAGEFWEIYKLDVVEIPTNKPLIRDDRHDLVYKTKKEKYKAVIDEIVRLVEAGRPVLVGTTSVEISELLSRYLTVRGIKHNVLNAKLHKKEAEIVAEAGKPGVVTIATNMAGRGTDIKLTPEVVKAGGLAIIGTERHDSRRVDRQLRGRAGRQGDPGSSQFFVALDDNLMRLFGSERISKLMDRMGLKEGEVIQHPMISKSIERAQKKVEENNFGIRKRLLEYDDIMNAQREVIYKRRRHALDGERLQVDINNMIYDAVESLVHEFKPDNNFEAFSLELMQMATMSPPLSQEEFKDLNDNEITEKVYSAVLEHYKQKMERNAGMAYPVIKHVYENEGNRYTNISVPFTDGIKELQVITNLEEAYKSEGKQLISDFEKNITLAIIDDNWKEHLRRMDELRTYVQNASYEQKDPLLIYKFEAFNLFKTLVDNINKEVVSFLFKGELPTANPNQVQQARLPKREKVQLSKAEFDHSAAEANRPQEPQIVETYRRSERKIGRNEIVTVTHIKTGEKKQMKYKKAIPLITNGEWVVTED